MTTSEMNISHWRKSSQWFAMQRRHAQVVADDVEVNQSFEKYCRYDLDPLLGRVRDCISDEVREERLNKTTILITLIYGLQGCPGAPI